MVAEGHAVDLVVVVPGAVVVGVLARAVALVLGGAPHRRASLLSRLSDLHWSACAASDLNGIEEITTRC